VFFHNTGSDGCRDIQADGQIEQGAASGVVFLTPQWFKTAFDAQTALALSQRPFCYFIVREQWTHNLFGPILVPPNNGQPGGGLEFTSTGPIVLPGGYRKAIPYYQRYDH
jgi:hypothetical protein